MEEGQGRPCCFETHITAQPPAPAGFEFEEGAQSSGQARTMSPKLCVLPYHPPLLLAAAQPLDTLEYLAQAKEHLRVVCVGGFTHRLTLSCAKNLPRLHSQRQFSNPHCRECLSCMSLLALVIIRPPALGVSGSFCAAHCIASGSFFPYHRPRRSRRPGPRA